MGGGRTVEPLRASESVRTCDACNPEVWAACVAGEPTDGCHRSVRLTPAGWDVTDLKGRHCPPWPHQTPLHYG